MCHNQQKTTTHRDGNCEGKDPESCNASEPRPCPLDDVCLCKLDSSIILANPVLCQGLQDFLRMLCTVETDEQKSAFA